MTEDTSPYDSYEETVNPAEDSDVVKHPTDEASDAGANETLESLKAAGTSAFGVAKEFTNRFREDRATHSDDSATPPSPEASEDGKKGSFIDRATDFAKDIGGSVRRA